MFQIGLNNIKAQLEEYVRTPACSSATCFCDKGPALKMCCAVPTLAELLGTTVVLKQ